MILRTERVNKNKLRKPAATSTRKKKTEKCCHLDSWHYDDGGDNDHEDDDVDSSEKSNESKHQKRKYFSCHRRASTQAKIFGLIYWISTLNAMGFCFGAVNSLSRSQCACFVTALCFRPTEAATVAITTIKLIPTFIHDCKKINAKFGCDCTVCGHVILFVCTRTLVNCFIYADNFWIFLFVHSTKRIEGESEKAEVRSKSYQNLCCRRCHNKIVWLISNPWTKGKKCRKDLLK